MQRSLIILCCLGLVGCGREAEVAHPAQSSVHLSTNIPGGLASAFGKLVGRWQRPDGGYVLDIKGIDASGKISAEYLNPNPIKISRAYAFTEAGETKVFVELQDVNYPGCTYALKYDARAEELVGQYYQAALRETYDIAFARIKD